MKRLFHDNKNRTSQKQSQQLVLTNLPNLSEAYLTVFNLIVSLSNRYISVYVRQSTIAKYSGYCRQYVNEIINDLKEWGYIDTWYRHMTSCVYYLNPIFNEGIIRRKYASILPALALFTISWLKAPDRETTQLSLFNYYNLFINPSVSVSTKREIFSGTETKESHSTKKIAVGGFGGYLKKEIVNMNKLLADKFLGNDDQPSYDNSSKNSQKRESVRTIPTFKTTFPNALVCKAQSLWLLSQQDRMSLDRARRELQERQDQYPEGIANLKAWYSTSEGSAFKEWIEQWP